MQILKSSICIVLHLCAFFSSIYCDDEVNIDDVTPSTDELKNIHSFFYGSTEINSPSLIRETSKNDQSSVIVQPYSCKETDERNTQDAIFYKRLIAVLLSNLVIQKIDDRLIGTLSIEASSAQFEYLQNFVNNQGSIREVDRILASVISQSQYSACHYMTEASHYFNLLSEYLIHCLFLIKEHWDITIISFTVIASFMILRRQRWSRGLIVFLMFDVIFIMSFFITWWRLIQEAEIKLMAAQAQFTEMPIACQPHKMNFWDKMVASFSSTNDCEKYYQTIMTNPRLQVTPAFALTHFLCTTIFQPFSYLGTVISEFIDNATSKLNFLQKFPVVIILFLSLCACIISLPFFLFGGSINFMGPFYKFGISGRAETKLKKEQQERIERICEDTSPKRLKHSEKKQTTLVQENDPAGGDAGGDTYHLSKKHKKCKCKNKDKDENMECEKEETDDDCQ
ncbi:uncharacterized protein [Linepithema humile]|uniref:uncharacterized protein isoform X1 n=1 Tax=Linepithema humile TaxID=83485 RepID=UPI00351E9097